MGAVVKAVESALGKEIQSLYPSDTAFVADDLYTRRTYGKDLWPRNLITAREGDLGEPTIDAVVWPGDVESLSKLVRVACEKDWELYPYGAGSGVCGGATPRGTAKRARLIVDLKRMDKIEQMDEISQCAKVQAGII